MATPNRRLPEQRKIKVLSQIEAAIKEYNNKNYDAAHNIGRQIISIDENNYYGNYVYGSCECIFGNIHVGIKSLAKCIASGNETFLILDTISTFVYNHKNLAKAQFTEDLLKTLLSVVRAAVALDPGNPRIYTKVGSLLAFCGRPEGTPQSMRTAAILNPFDWMNWLGLADAYSRKKRFSNVARAEICYSHALVLAPDSPEGYTGLGLARFWQAKDEQAVVSLHRARVLNPAIQGIDKTLREIEAHAVEKPGAADPSRPRLVRYPKQISELKNIRDAVQTHVLKGYTVPKKLDPASSLTVTFGSCFANSISIALNERNIETAYITVGEVVNTTFANNFFLDWVVGGTADDGIQRVHEFSAMKPEDIIGKLRQADMVIYTLGVAWAFFEKNTDKFVMPKSSAITMSAMATKLDFRLTSVEENRDNILRIIRKIRRINPDCMITFTLSPVPMQANFAGVPAFEADCLSKSTLRLALQDALKAAKEQNIDGIYYWPSFEIVRWLAPYVLPPFGVEDGSTVHVSEDVVDTITDGFIRVFYTDGPETGAGA
ncbi:tetratricopeptide (TPR) repeat protein [Azospirillum fermentarium]|uniref:GSCFA domain-containing protein n=1 Tax=Azospirillum fermentarium TaxID=1233114 RepID=UPI0022272D10|nr:GSCFA domain-containing protein [Azospirillum fermentarium]MCW2245599.1 tetratricopeptide (TPR) repeat protein [Azospirillum fermentarium]